MVLPTTSTIKHPVNRLRKAIFLSLPFVFSMGLAGCGDDNIDPNAINAPNTYEFSRNGVSSVDYSDASTLLILIKELESLIASNYLQEYGKDHNKDEIISLLNRIYEGGTIQSYQDNLVATDLYSNNTSATPIQGFDLENEAYFSDIKENINIKDKLPDINNQQAEKLIASTFSTLANLALDDKTQSKFIDTGIDHQARTISLLRVGIPYATITQLLSEQSLEADNTAPLIGTQHTQLEHNWDMAFGLSGSTINLKQHSSDTIVSQHNQQQADLNALLTHKTDSLIYKAALIDQASTLSATNLAQSIHQNFLNGRTLIIQLQDPNNTPEDTNELRNTLVEERNTLLSNLERVIIAITIAEINNTVTLASLAEAYPILYSSIYSKVWSRLHSYSRILEFNPQHAFSEKDDLTLPELSAAVRTNPSLNETIIKNFKTELLRLRDVLSNKVKFSNELIESWEAIEL